MSEHLTPAQVQAVVDEINAYFVSHSSLYYGYRVAILWRYLDVAQEMYAVFAQDMQTSQSLEFIRLNGNLVIAACGKPLYSAAEGGVYPFGVPESEAGGNG